MATRTRCLKCNAEPGDSQTTTRAHSIPCVGPDGMGGRFFVTLCTNCFLELEQKKQLDAFAEEVLGRPADAR